MSWRQRAIMFGATAAYCGRSPVAPGTVGSLPALVLAVGLNRCPTLVAVVLMASLTALAVWLCGAAEHLLGRRDPGSVVIDEVVGMLVTLWGLPLEWTYLLAGFILFRVLDIVKPFPIGWIDRRLHGGVGIVADDVAAGAAANLLLRLGGLGGIL